MKCPFLIRKCTKCKKLLVAYSGNFVRNKNKKWGLEAVCKQCTRLRNNQYKAEHKDELADYYKQYGKKNKEKISKYNKQRKEKQAEYYKEYVKNNPTVRFNNHNKRRHLEQTQGRGITKEQWLEMMIFFDWKCAYSGESLTDINRTIDHIIALNNSGLNEPWNCVPMTRSYNSSKRTQNMVEWYKQQEFFNIDRLMKIYEWQEYAFEKWGETLS